MSTPAEQTPDNLCERIARTLYERWWHISMSTFPPPQWDRASASARERWLEDAAALIRELGIREEWSTARETWFHDHAGHRIDHTVRVPAGEPYMTSRDQAEHLIRHDNDWRIESRLVTDWKSTDA